MNQNNKALLLINLGTPNRPTYSSVFRYLNQFLSDKRVLDIPYIFRFILVKFIICPFRSLSSSKLYKSLWSKYNNQSPLKLYTKNIANKISIKKPNLDVYFCMRYQKPSIKETIQSILLKNPEELIILPLFPHYASSTTGSIFDEVNRELSRYWSIPKIRFIHQFYNHPQFINSWINNVNKYDINEYDKILFSYHGLPNSHVNKIYNDKTCNDEECTASITENNKFCYKATTHATTRLISNKLDIAKDKTITCYQSRLSKRWIQPFTDNVIRSLVNDGHKKILVIAPSFTSDNLETIIEIGEEYKNLFMRLGGEKFDFVESLNDSEIWTNALIDIMEG